MTVENDLVLIHYEDQPMSYARVEQIVPDHKPGWYHVTLLLLQVPLQVVTWILRDVYIEGEEFTMGGKKMRLELVVSPVTPSAEEEDEDAEPEKPPQKPGKVISLTDMKKKDS